MKKRILIICMLILGLASAAQAYTYSFDFQSGDISLHVAENCSLLSIVTINDLIVDMDIDAAPEDTLYSYTASLDMTLGLFGMFNYDLDLSDLDLGTFQGFDLDSFFGDGTAVMAYTVTDTVSGQFGDYSLTDATLEYDITVTPDDSVEDRYAITIDTLSLYDGNTSELLSGLINELNESDESPISLEVPFTVPITLSGTMDIQAEPVPVPAGIWLLGSGLLGLIGLKRNRRPAA